MRMIDRDHLKTEFPHLNMRGNEALGISHKLSGAGCLVDQRKAVSGIDDRERISGIVDRPAGEDAAAFVWQLRPSLLFDRLAHFFGKS